MVQVHPLLDAARLLHDLQTVNEITQSLVGQQSPAVISRLATDALVERFDCAFARIWLVEPDQTGLRLIASSGLYTHTDGAFARVPMGAYKVGKIAQNRVSFLSNQLAEESWVKDRQWAIDNQIQGFAGHPLAVGHRVVGVLASFSHSPFAPEFLEVLQVLCMTLTVALDAALRPNSPSALSPSVWQQSLSDQIAQILGTTQLTLVGTERPLRPALDHILLQAAAALKHLDCSYCRLTYTPFNVTLEAIALVDQRHSDSAAASETVPPSSQGLTALRSHFADLQYLVTDLGGVLQTQPVMQGRACQISLVLPAVLHQTAVRIQCQHLPLQQRFTQLAYQAGLTISEHHTTAAVLITDHPTLVETIPVLWVQHDASPVPEQVAGIVDRSTTSNQLRQLIEQLVAGQVVRPQGAQSLLSNREQQVMQLLAKGKRDRDIAHELYISESTVKFHINNSLAKLKAKNRYQGVYQAAIRGWI